MKPIAYFLLFMVLVSGAYTCRGKKGTDELTCEGRCGDVFSWKRPCQCNWECEKYKNCCNDFKQVCASSNTPRTTAEPRPISTTSRTRPTTARPATTRPTTTRPTTNAWPRPTPSSFNTPKPTTEAWPRPTPSSFNTPKPTTVAWPRPTPSRRPNTPTPTPSRRPNIPNSPQKVSNSDLKRLSEQLLTMDRNNAGRYITLDPQGNKNNCDENDDRASRPLISRIDNQAWKLPTVEKLIQLLDNYNPSVLQSEEHTHQQIQEEQEFFQAVFSSNITRAVYNFLNEKGIFTGSGRDFKKRFKELWFDYYDRDGNPSIRTLGSSGFEHVFLGELKKNEVGGFHHWVYYAKEEAAGNINYLGKKSQTSFGKYGYGFTGVFIWKGNKKCVGSMMVGTSPELDMALYTLCFMTRESKKCRLTLNNQPVTITTYPLTYRGKKLIGTAYPDFR